MGLASLVFWTISLVVSFKYMLFITLADHDGEGGAFALANVLVSRVRKSVAFNFAISAFVISSTALLFADSLITPPLSIMASVEGLKGISEAAGEWVIPVSVVLIVVLYALQRLGTNAIAGLFSPVLLTWFVVIGALGLVQIAQRPEVLLAVSPHYAFDLLSVLSWPQILSLFGAVLLAATGAEAIYADLGHLGRKPIAQAWYGVAMFGLLFSYFGQSAWLLSHAEGEHAAHNSFFAIVPPALLMPVVLLATVTSVIAGQAVITGMFSIVAQAARQGYLPRLRVIHTSDDTKGQIYVPTINALLLAGGVILVVSLGSSSALASSYGFAVAAAMLLTTIAFTAVTVVVWRWRLFTVAVFVALTLPFDVLFFSAAAYKMSAGYLITPFVVLLAVLVMSVWCWGNRKLADKVQRLDLEPADFADIVRERADLTLLPRAALFFSNLPLRPVNAVTPYALLQQVKLTYCLYQPTVIVEILTAATPRVRDEDRISLHDFGQGIYVVRVTFGYRERLSIMPVVNMGIARGWWDREEDIVYYSTQETILPAVPLAPSMLAVRSYALLKKFDQVTARQFQVESTRLAEMGTIIRI
jgi:KUP system potassium uptake protein